MTETSPKPINKLLNYWILTATKNLSSSIHILKEESDVLRTKKRYEKEGYFVSIEKK
jgi:hypothetical protein